MNLTKSKNGKIPINLIGQKFGRLLVLDYVGQNKNHASMWECRCDCGKIKTVLSGSLRSGMTRSCGCLQRDATSKPEEQLSRRKLYTSLRAGARGRKIEFLLSPEDVNALSKQNCFYCGKEPSPMYAHRNKNLKYNSIDRVDSGKGYVSGNVVSCCSDCNYAKRKMSVQEFVRWIDKVSRSSFFLLQKFGGRFCSLVEASI